MTRTIHYCNFCDYKSDRRYDRDKHVNRKHGNDHSAPSQAGSGAVQSVQPHSEDHSNLQEESVDQLYENIDQWQKAYNTLKLQHQQEEKVPENNPKRKGSFVHNCCKWDWQCGRVGGIREFSAILWQLDV